MRQRWWLIGLLAALLGARVPSVTTAQTSPPPASAPAAVAATLKLPFPAGSAWRVLQGYNGGTHVPGPERYALDLLRDDGASANADVIAPVSGTLWWMNPPGTGNGCLLIKSDGPSGLIVQMCHIVARPFRVDERITLGQPVGAIGASGAVGNNGIAHLHYSLHRTNDFGVTRVPAPFAGPDGMALEGGALPPDGSSNQYACPGQSCRPAFVSTNGRADARPTTPGTIPAPASAPPPLTPALPLRPGVTARVIGGDCLNVRDAAGLGGRVVACIADGAAVTIQQGPIQADGRQWWRLEERGWVASEFLSGVSASAPTLKLAAAVQVDAGENDCLNLRKDADTSATVLACLPSGARMTISAGPREADGRTWWELDGRGWAAAEFLRPREDS